VGVEVVQVGAVDTTTVTSPRVIVAVESFVEEIKRWIGERDTTVLTLPVGIPFLKRSLMNTCVVVDRTQHLSILWGWNPFPGITFSFLTLGGQVLSSLLLCRPPSS